VSKLEPMSRADNSSKGSLDSDGDRETYVQPRAHRTARSTFDGPPGQVTWSEGVGKAKESEIVKVEKAFGVRFPDDYRNFVKMHRGGSPSPQEIGISGGQEPWCLSNAPQLRTRRRRLPSREPRLELLARSMTRSEAVPKSRIAHVVRS
jgi:hypothetical protein